jgi:Zn-dependent peptidase ImmA (M78 family)
MPVSLLERDLHDVEAFDPEDEIFTRTLAKRYRVSSQALTFRLANLGYIQLD